MGNLKSKLFNRQYTMTNADIHFQMLSNLSVIELVAVERVSKQYQRDVKFYLRKITQLAVCSKQSVHWPSDFCVEPGHHFAYQHIYRAVWTSANLPPLIRKLPNLEAVFVGGHIIDNDELFVALAKCSKLSHVEIRGGSEVQHDRLHLSRIKCLGCVSWTPTVLQCPRLKYITGAAWPEDGLIENLLEHFENGLLGLSNDSVDWDITPLIEHARHLRVLNIATNVNMTPDQVAFICTELNELRTFRVLGDRLFTDPVELATNLKTFIWNALNIQKKSLDEYFWDLQIGHRFKKIDLEVNFEGDVINGIAKFCPNLKELAIRAIKVLENKSPFHVHNKLEVLEVLNESLKSNEDEFRLLVTRLPNLRTFRASNVRDISPGMTTEGVKQWINDAKHDFHEVNFDIPLEI